MSERDEVGEIECVVCRMTSQRAKILELEDHVRWLNGMLESSRQINRMWEETARYAIDKIGRSNDDTQAIEAYSDPAQGNPGYPHPAGS